MSNDNARRIIIAATVTVALLLGFGVGTAFAAESADGDAARGGRSVHTYRTGIARTKPARAVHEVGSAPATELPPGVTALAVAGEAGGQCAMYRWAVGEKQDALIYNEKWSNFNGTDANSNVMFTTTQETDWEWHVNGTLSATVLGLGLEVTGGTSQTFKTLKGVSNTATAGPHQWITARFGAWFTKQEASDLTCVHPDGSDGTHYAGTFEIWLPSGASGWVFTNDPPSRPD